MEYVQRPFLNVSPLKIEVVIRKKPDGSYVRNHVFKIIWQNSGNTPAMRVVHFLNGAEMTEPTEEQFRGDLKLPPDATPEVIPSKSESIPQAMEKPESFILGELVNVPPEKRIGGAINHPTFIWGWAAYRDVFASSKVHVSEFCLKSVGIEFSETSPDSAPIVHFRSCSNHGYCIDEQCKDYKEIASLVE